MGLLENRKNQGMSPSRNLLSPRKKSAKTNSIKPLLPPATPLESSLVAILLALCYSERLFKAPIRWCTWDLSIAPTKQYQAKSLATLQPHPRLKTRGECRLLRLLLLSMILNIQGGASQTTLSPKARRRLKRALKRS